MKSDQTTIIDSHAFEYNELDVISTETVTTGDLVNLTTGQTTYDYNPLSNDMSGNLQDRTV